MGIFDRFPYSSTHEMNLDFMLGKATEIAESLQEVQDGLSDIDTHKAQAEQAAQAAQASQAAASASAGQAAQHVTNAEDAADRAETASTEAETAADRAETALGNMTDSETVCMNAATRAEAAQAAVAESASAASSSAANASLNASQAATSAGSAANSANDAASSAQSANVSANNASLHASNASTSATNAATSATNAATSATNAASSASSAAESKEQVDTLVESLPEDFTELNTKVNNLEKDKADLLDTRNIWPFASSETFTNSKLWGTMGVDMLPAGHYTMSFDITAENTITWYVYSGASQEGSSTFDPSTGKAVFAFTASNPIQRIFLNTTGNVEISNIQLEILNWIGYDMSNYNQGLKTLSYANNYIEQKSPIDAEAREYPSNWVGKKINYNGDSITQATGTGYAKVVNQLLRFGTVRNYAIGGTRLAHVEGIAYSLIDRYQDMDTDADIIFIMANTNDYASQVPLGAEDSTDINTYNGALNVLMNWLKNTYPTQPIIISTMLTRKVNIDPTTGQPLPIPIEDYAECVRKRTLEHHLILYDAYNLSGMDLSTSPRDGTGITNDGLHPNAAGELALGRKIAAFINAQ